MSPLAQVNRFELLGPGPPNDADMPKSQRIHGLLSRAAIVAATAFACLGIVACAPVGGEGYVPVYRFADIRSPATEALGFRLLDKAARRMGRARTIGLTGQPTATIGDDTRYVLPGAHSVYWVRDFTVSPPTDGSIRISGLIGGDFDPPGLLLLSSRYRSGNRWTDMPRRRVEELDFAKGRLGFSAVLPAPPAAAELQLLARWVPDRGSSEFESKPLRVPAGAYLDFAVGLLDGVELGRDAIFRIEACERENCRELYSERLGSSKDAQRGWLERRLDLAPLAGARRVFRFSAASSGEGFSLPAWANPTIYAPQSSDAGGYNVILLSVDTLRADHLNSYGYRRNTAPVIDRAFAQQGTVFENYVAAATSTTPAHMTMFTSVQPCVHGVHSGITSLSPAFVTLSETLRAAGFETVAVTEDGWLGIEFGFGRGFNVYVENKSPLISAPTGQVDRTFARAKRWLRDNSDKRFFLFLHTFQVHDPYAPPARYAAQLPADEAFTVGWSAAKDALAYDREIRYVDDEIDSLLEELERLSLSERTIFMLTSDHGEEFGEHGYIGHGAHLHDEVVHVPLMVRGPGIVQGRRVADVVSQRDLMPTILDLVAVPEPSQLRGRSFAQVLTGADPRSAGDSVVYAEAWAPRAKRAPKDFVAFVSPGLMLRYGDLKLHRYIDGQSYRYEFYDLSQDPAEKHNLAVGGHPRLAELIAMLSRYAGECGIGDLGGGTGGSTVGSEGRVGERELLLDPAREEKLRALGYID